MPKTDDSILDDSLCISTRLAISVQSMGLKPGNVVLSLGVVSFNLFEELGNLHVVFNMAEQLKAGLTLDPDTLAWWAETDPDTLLQLIIQTNAEKEILDRTIIRARDAVVSFFVDGIKECMNRFNLKKIDDLKLKN